ncbi:MAG: iron(III) transport system substrate-binding protein [Hyphomicrobiales bacterium]
MTQTGLTRRQALHAGAALGSLAIVGPARAAKPFTPSDSLLEAARKEGKITLYTATFVEVEQEVVNEFRKKFPFIRIEMIRAPGGQLITRVKTEAASGKLAADVLIHSDRGLTKGIENIFADYTPPNAADYLPESLVSPKLWPTLTAGWSIAYNSEIVKNPPKSWMDLTKPEYGDGQIAQVIGQSGGTTWTRIMFERQVLGEDYWAREAATKPKLYPSGAPCSDALVRGEFSIAPLVYNIVYPKQRDGAPIKTFFPPEGVPIVPYGSGIPKTAQNPNAARLYMDWLLSEEGQTFQIKQHGNLTSLKVPPLYPEGMSRDTKFWVPKFAEFESLYGKWIEEWNKVYGYRQ